MEQAAQKVAEQTRTYKATESEREELLKEASEAEELQAIAEAGALDLLPARVLETVAATANL